MGGEGGLPTGRGQVLQRSLRRHAGGDRAGRGTRHAAADRAAAGQRAWALAWRGSGRLHRVQPGRGQCGDRHPPARRQAPVHRHPGAALRHDQRHAAGRDTALRWCHRHPWRAVRPAPGPLRRLGPARTVLPVRPGRLPDGGQRRRAVGSEGTAQAREERPHRLRPAPGRRTEHRYRGRPADRVRRLLLGQPPAAAGHRRTLQRRGQRVLLRLGHGTAGRLHLAEADDVGLATVPGRRRVRAGTGGQRADHACASGRDPAQW
ncbi:hypothetical protein G6F22_015988 [Rhizopus arrhizus]|nr:hypothetical protein G6F22_015988 [Rhizopus arrhizus]